jgi:hypothetical protein
MDTDDSIRTAESRKGISEIEGKAAGSSEREWAPNEFQTPPPISSIPSFLIRKSESAEICGICGSPSSVYFVLFVVE